MHISTHTPSLSLSVSLSLFHTRTHTKTHTHLPIVPNTWRSCWVHKVGCGVDEMVARRLPQVVLVTHCRQCASEGEQTFSVGKCCRTVSHTQQTADQLVSWERGRGPPINMDISPPEMDHFLNTLSRWGTPSFILSHTHFLPLCYFFFSAHSMFTICVCYNGPLSSYFFLLSRPWTSRLENKLSRTKFQYQNNTKIITTCTIKKGFLFDCIV